MKTIVCYGDSNTWGYTPGTGERYPADVRWSGVLQKSLGERARVVEEGLNGRTTMYDEPARPGRNGATFLPIVLETHAPIDVLVLMLGTNDIVKFSDVSAADAAIGMGKLIDTTRIVCARLELPCPKILVVSPPLVLPVPAEEYLVAQNAPLTSQEFSVHYRALAQRLSCGFLDAAEFAQASEIDGSHLEPEGHRQLGVAVAQAVLELI